MLRALPCCRYATAITMLMFRRFSLLMSCRQDAIRSMFHHWRCSSPYTMLLFFKDAPRVRHAARELPSHFARCHADERAAADDAVVFAITF